MARALFVCLLLVCASPKQVQATAQCASAGELCGGQSFAFEGDDASVIVSKCCGDHHCRGSPPRCVRVELHASEEEFPHTRKIQGLASPSKGASFPQRGGLEDVAFAEDALRNRLFSNGKDDEPQPAGADSDSYRSWLFHQYLEKTAPEEQRSQLGQHMRKDETHVLGTVR